MQNSLNQAQYLNENEKIALNCFIINLRKKLSDELVRVVLYGSKARGDADVCSDIDILVECKEDNVIKIKKQIASIVSDVLLQHNIFISVNTLTEEEFKKLEKFQSAFIDNLNKEGIEL